MWETFANVDLLGNIVKGASPNQRQVATLWKNAFSFVHTNPFWGATIRPVNQVPGGKATPVPVLGRIGLALDAKNRVLMINDRFKIKFAEAEDSAYQQTIESAPNFHYPQGRGTVPFAATGRNLYVANQTTLWKLPPMGSEGNPEPHDYAADRPDLEGGAIVDLCACEEHGHMFVTFQKDVQGVFFSHSTLSLAWTSVVDLDTLEFVDTLLSRQAGLIRPTNVTTTALVNGKVWVCDSSKVHVYEHCSTKRRDPSNPSIIEKLNEEQTPWTQTLDNPIAEIQPKCFPLAVCSVSVEGETRIFMTESMDNPGPESMDNPGRGRHILVTNTNGTLLQSNLVLSTNERFVGRMLVRTIDGVSYLYTTVNTGTGVALSVRTFQITGLWK